MVTGGPVRQGRRSAANLLRSNPHARRITRRSTGITQAGMTCPNVFTLVSGHHKSTVNENQVPITFLGRLRHSA
jgi:hypothetical protein